MRQDVRWFLYCVETEQGVYFGRIRASSDAQADRLIRQWLLNLGHQRVEQVVTRAIRHDDKTEFTIEVFDSFAPAEAT